MIRKLKELLLKNTSVRQTVLKNMFWLFSGEFSARMIRAVIIIYAARLLGAAEYGVFSYAMSLAAFVTIFSDIGVGAILTREVSKDPNVRLKYFSTAFIIKITLIITNVAVVLFVAPFITRMEAAITLLPLVATLFFFDSFREFGFAMFRAFEKMEWEALIKVATNTGVAIFGFWFIHRMATASSLATGYVLGTSVGFLITAWAFRSYFRDLFTNFDRTLVIKILGYAWPIGIMVLLGALMINTDMVMLGWWRTSAEIGYYAAAQKPVQLFYVIPALLVSAFLPTFSRLAHVNNERFAAILQKSLTLVFAFAIPMAIGGLIVAPEITHLLYGSEYLPAAFAFRLLIATLVLNFPATIIANSIFAYNQQRRLIPVVLVGAVGDIILNALFIPRFGIAGAAVTTIFSQAIYCLLVWRTMNRINHFRVLPALKNIGVAAIVMGLATVGLNALGTPVIITVITSAAVYALVLYIRKEPLLTEVRSIVTSASPTEAVSTKMLSE